MFFLSKKNWVQEKSRAPQSYNQSRKGGKEFVFLSDINRSSSEEQFEAAFFASSSAEMLKEIDSLDYLKKFAYFIVDVVWSISKWFKIILRNLLDSLRGRLLC